MEAILKIKGLKSYYYSGQNVIPAVDGVDLDIYPGEIVGIVGESGCGKSTVVRSLMGLLDPVSSKREGGQAIYLGKDLFQMKEKELCRIRGKEISMIFQNPLSALDPVYTIGDQIVEIIRIHEKISKKEAYEKAVFLLKQVKIPSPEVRIQQYPHELSGGMQQRVMIAIALACNPKVLIADEPTTALDVTIQDQILRQLKELEKELGIAVILITHNMGVVAAVCDRMLVMYGGAVVEEGKCTEYDVLIQEAEKAEISSIVDVDNNMFTSPLNMAEVITSYCKESNQQVPQTQGEFVKCVLLSLADRYRKGIEGLNRLLPHPVDKLHIIGGGSQNKYLNRLTAMATGLEVDAGPVEATAIGNILVQDLN